MRNQFTIKYGSGWIRFQCTAIGDCPHYDTCVYTMRGSKAPKITPDIHLEMRGNAVLAECGSYPKTVEYRPTGQVERTDRWG